MGLTNVWVQTQADGLVRADHVTGIEAHQTPALAGKPSHWLLTLVLPVATGSGGPAEAGGSIWQVAPVHRTVIQTPDHPGDAPAALARLFAQLDPISAAGVITAEIAPRHTGGAGHGQPTGAAPDTTARDADHTDVVAPDSRVRFRFTPFPRPPAPSHDTESQYA